jgi:hypothetical protein
MRRQFVSGCALLIALWSSPALSYNAASDLNYQVQSETLSGYFGSWKDPWDYDYSGVCLWPGWSDYGYYCLVYEETWYWVGVTGEIYRPDGQLHASGTAEGWQEAQVSFSETVTTPVVWTGSGNHYVEAYVLVWYCPAPGYCYPTGGGSFSNTFANTQDQSVVLPVRIEYTMLIPLDHVRLPILEKFFDGDSAYSYSPAVTYRVQQAFVIDTENKSVTQLQNDSGVTYGYTPAQPSLSSSASCFRKNCPECPEYFTGQTIVYDGFCKIPGTHSCASQATDIETMAASVSSSSSSSVTVFQLRGTSLGITRSSYHGAPERQNTN